MDKISSVGKMAMLKSVSVGTSSGRISFAFLKNSSKVYDEINKLISNRNSNQTIEEMPKVEKTTQTSNFDDLKILKELLDSGVITQEEYDIKKKQLLDL